uniref:Uncharacterized protein n=1 Tax=Rhizophagus irregularis (strain DAOM 181602 / DAOM 197198 / MUCL 43194) TaxID=747089 RepID=U9SGX3_RHIID
MKRIKRKRKRGDEYFDCLVSTGRDWHFLLYLPGEIYRGSNFYLSSGIVDKSTTADENTTSKPVDEDANVIVMNELGLLGGENKVRPRLLRLLKKLRPGNQPY